MSPIRYLISLISKYNVEPVLFLYMLSRNLYVHAPLIQLINDKICVNNFLLSPSDFCYHINEPQFKDTQNATDIAKESVQYIMYGQLILSIPSIAAALFLGPLLDRYPIFPKVVLILNLFAGLFESTFILFNVFYFKLHVGLVLLSHIFNGLMGGNLLFMTATFTIAVKETPFEERTFRFAIIELFMLLAAPLGNFIASFILPISPAFGVNEQVPRNYVPILLIAIICYLLNLILVIFSIGEVKEIISPNDSVLKRASIISTIQPINTEYLNPSIENTIDQIHKNADNYDGNNNNLKDHSVSFDESLPIINNKDATKSQILSSLFSTENISDMMVSLFKWREDKARKLLWITIFIYLNTLIVANGNPLIIVNFVSKVFAMESTRFMQIESTAHIFYGLLTTALLFYLHKKEVDDTKIILIGLISSTLIYLIRGSVLYPIGFYFSYFVGTISLCTLIGCRSFVSKIIPKDDIGKIMSVLSVVYAASPAIASFIFPLIFKATIESMPGLAYLIAAFIMVITVVLGVYLDVKYNGYKDIKRIKNIAKI